jgi:hypothetical protein
VAEYFHSSRKYFKGQAKQAQGEQQCEVNLQYNRPDMDNPKNNHIHIWAAFNAQHIVKSALQLPVLASKLTEEQLFTILRSGGGHLQEPYENVLDLVTSWKDSKEGLLVESTFIIGMTKPNAMPLWLVRLLNPVFGNMLGRGKGAYAMAKAFLEHNVEEFGNFPQFLPRTYNDMHGTERRAQG